MTMDVNKRIPCHEGLVLPVEFPALHIQWGIELRENPLRE